MESQEVRLARIEERQQALHQRFEEFCDSSNAMLEKYIETQGKANDAFWKNVGDVQDMKASAKGAWFVATAASVVTAALASCAAWIFSIWKGPTP